MKHLVMDYEQAHWDELSDEFIEKNAELWADFVMDKFQDYLAGQNDALYDFYKDEGLLDKVTSVSKE